MKILHIVPSYIPAYRYGGPIQSVHGLCRGLVKRGHDVHVYTTDIDGDGSSKVPIGKPVDIDGVKVRYFRGTRMRRIFRAPAMKTALRACARDFDVFHLHSIFLWPIWTGAGIARDAGVPYVLTPRGMLVKDLILKKSRFAKTLWLRLVGKKIIERASAIHFTSLLEEQEATLFGMRFQRTFIIPNGMEVNDFVPARDELVRVREHIVQKPYLLFLGRISWKKGLDRLIPALAAIPEITLVIAGNDEENYRGALEEMGKKYNVYDRIIFTGGVYGKEKAGLLTNAALFILPSYSENFGNAVLEAMEAGCPVVVTPEVGLAQAVEESGAGLVVGGEPEILASGIKSLLSSPETLRMMRERARHTVETCFTWDAIAEAMERQYLSLCVGT